MSQARGVPTGEPSLAAGSVRAAGLVSRLGGLDVVVCCGAGGVGKTTVSASLAAAIAAASDRRVMVLTVDPARRLATALGIEIGADPVRVPAARMRRAGLPLRGHLVAAMLDQKSVWDRMVERYAPNRRTAQRILQNRFYQGISDAFAGSHEYTAMESLYELHEGGEYDCLVVDTPPSRSALDFLDAPDRLADYVGARLLTWLAGPSRFGFRAMNLAAAPLMHMADRLLGSDLLGELGEFVNDLQTLYGGIQSRARSVSRLLRSQRVGFLIVTSLEPAAFAEAERFAASLRERSMPLRAVVVNRVLPDFLRDEEAVRTAEALAGDHRAAAALGRALDTRVDAALVASMAGSFSLLSELAQRDAQQLARLRGLRDVVVARVPLIAGPVNDLEGLARVAASL